LIIGCLLAAGIVAITRIEHSYLNDFAADYLTEKLQREVTINGSLNVRVGSALELSVRELSIASLDWTAADTLLTVASADAVINLMSLLSDEIIIDSLVIDGLRIDLEENSAGLNNWSLGNAEDDSVSDEPPRIPVRFSSLSLTQTLLEYRAPGLQDELLIKLDGITQNILADKSAELRLGGNVDGTSVTFAAFIADIDNFNRLQKVDLTFNGDLGEISLDGDAFFEDLLNPSRPTATVKLAGPNVQYLADVVGLKDVQPGPLAVDINIAPQNDTMAFTGLGTIGALQVSTNGSFDDLRVLDDAQATFNIAGANLAGVAAIFGVDGLPAQAFSLSGDVRKRSKAIDISDARLTLGDTNAGIDAHFDEFPSPNGAKATLTMAGPRIQDFGALTGFDDEVQGPFSAKLLVSAKEDGSADISLSANAVAATLEATGNVQDKPGLAGTALSVQMNGENIANMARLAGSDIDLPALPVAISAVLERGQDTTEIKNSRITVGNDVLQLRGTVGDEPISSATRLNFDIAIPNIRKAAALFAAANDAIPMSSMQAQGALTMSDDGLNLSALDATIDDVEIKVDGLITDLSTLPLAELGYSVAGPDLASLVPELQQYDAATSPFSINGKMRLDSTMLNLTDIDAKVSNGKLSGSASIGRFAPFDKIKADIKASSEDIFGLTAGIADIQGPKNMPMQLNIRGDFSSSTANVQKLNLRIGEAQLSADGRITEPPAYTGSNLLVSASAPDVGMLAKLFGFTLPSHALKMDFRAASGDRQLLVNDLRMTLGDSDLNGKLSYTQGTASAITADLKSSMLNLTEYLADSDTPEPLKQPKTPPKAERLIPDTKINLDTLGRFNIDFDLVADRIIDGPWRANNLVISGAAKDGGLSIRRLELQEDDGGGFSAQFSLKPLAGSLELRGRANGTKLSWGLPVASQQEMASRPQYDVASTFVANGQTIREMAGSTNGHFKVVFGQGKLKTLGMKIFTSDFLSQLITTINPFLKSDPYTNLECAVALATVDGGQLSGKPAVVAKTQQLLITASTNIDLKTEKLSADISTLAQQGLRISLSDLINPYIQIKGTLANPALALNKQSTVIEGGAAIATGGISILAKNLADRMLSSKDPCGAAIENAKNSFAAIEKKHGLEPTE